MEITNRDVWLCLDTGSVISSASLSSVLGTEPPPFVVFLMRTPLSLESVSIYVFHVQMETLL